MKDLSNISDTFNWYIDLPRTRRLGRKAQVDYEAIDEWCTELFGPKGTRWTSADCDIAPAWCFVSEKDLMAFRLRWL